VAEKFIYVIRSSDGRTKVGISANPRRRLQALQSGDSSKLNLGYQRPISRELAVRIERRAHWLMQAAHVHGEWFLASVEEAIDAVNAAAECDGEGERAASLAGRKLLWPDKIVAPLKEGTLKRIVAVLLPSESKTDFLREAVERELSRRERKG
jgi:hypothetical protein